MPLKPIAIVIALLALGGAVWLLIAATRHRRRWIGLLLRLTPAVLLLALVVSLGSYIFGFSGPHPYYNRAAPVPASTVIYQLVYSDPLEQPPTVQTLTLTAIQGQTGKTLWQRPMTGANTAAFAPGADAVYVVTRSYSPPDSSLFALSATTGSILWQETLPNTAGQSLVFAQGALYLLVTPPNPSSGQQLIALRPSDGARLWAVSIGSVPLAANLFLWATNDTLIVQFSIGGFQARSMTDGRLLWSDSSFNPSIVPGADAIYEFSTIGPVVARDAQTGVMLWQFGANNDHVHTGVVSGDTLFVDIQHAGPEEDAQGKIINPETVYALDALSGRLRWTFATQSRDSGSLAAGRDTVYIQADDGIHALRSSDGAVRWRSDSSNNWTFDGFSARPAVVDPVLYVTALEMLPQETFTVFGSSKAQTYLYAVNEADGSVNWSIAVGPVITIHPHFLS